jgi:hypothetical protein
MAAYMQRCWIQVGDNDTDFFNDNALTVLEEFQCWSFIQSVDIGSLHATLC